MAWRVALGLLLSGGVSFGNTDCEVYRQLILEEIATTISPNAVNALQVLPQSEREAVTSLLRSSHYVLNSGSGASALLAPRRHQAMEAIAAALNNQAQIQTVNELIPIIERALAANRVFRRNSDIELMADLLLPFVRRRQGRQVDANELKEEILFRASDRIDSVLERFLRGQNNRPAPGGLAAPVVEARPQYVAPPQFAPQLESLGVRWQNLVSARLERVARFGEAALADHHALVDYTPSGMPLIWEMRWLGPAAPRVLYVFNRHGQFVMLSAGLKNERLENFVNRAVATWNANPNLH